MLLFDYIKFTVHKFISFLRYLCFCKKRKNNEHRILIQIDDIILHEKSSPESLNETFIV